MLFKLSNLNSNLALTLGYLNPALNNSAQVFIDPAFFGIFVGGPLQSFMVNVNFVSTILYCVALVYNSYIFSEHPF